MDTIIVNGFGKLTGWNSITLRLLGRDVVGIRRIQYSDEQQVENGYGAGKMPVGEEEGNYSATAAIDLLNEEVAAIQNALPPNTRMQDIPWFDIVVTYERAGQQRTDIIHNCRFTNNGVEVNQGDGSIVRSFTLKTSHISHNV